ncbi:MAG TPA: hypothetical protein PKN50_05610 [Spirochaetota bacterium]|nr:hypothetical protein [Spirochaetota bacterium]HPV42888.1 hypothetical protein [Spirochaetota bacterium]
MPDNPAVFLGIIAMAVVSYLGYSLLKTRSLKEITGFFLCSYRPRAEIAGIVLLPDEEGALRHVTAGEQTLRLFLRYDVAYQWNSDDCSDDEVAYGLVVAVKINVPGRGAHEIIMGFGALIPREVGSFTGISYGARFSRTTDACRYRVTIPLHLVEGCVPGMEVTVDATVRQSPNITNAEYKLFFTG